MRWDLVTLVSLIFTAIITPFETATLDMVWWDALFNINRVVDLVFLTDMVFSFNTGKSGYVVVMHDLATNVKPNPDLILTRDAIDNPSVPDE